MPWSRYSAFWANEAGGTQRSADGKNSLCSCAAAAGKPQGGILQSGWVPESFEVRRASPSTAPDSGTRKCTLPALRPNSSQHLHQFTHAAEFDAADEGTFFNRVCGADLRG